MASINYSMQKHMSVLSIEQLRWYMYFGRAVNAIQPLQVVLNSNHAKIETQFVGSCHNFADNKLFKI